MIRGWFISDPVLLGSAMTPVSEVTRAYGKLKDQVCNWTIWLLW